MTDEFSLGKWSREAFEKVRKNSYNQALDDVLKIYCSCKRKSFCIFCQEIEELKK